MKDSREIKTSLERAIRAMELRPALARACYSGRAVLEGDGLRCTYNDGAHEIAMDVPAAVGGDGSAPSPGAYARAALSGCLAIGIKMFACLRGIPLSRVTVDLEVDADDRADFGLDGVPPGYEAFRMAISVESSADPDAVIEVVNHAISVSPLVALHRQPQDVAIEISAPAITTPRG